MKTYEFCYTIDGVHTLVPTFIHVKAYGLKAARVKAHLKLGDILRSYGRAHWEWEGNGPWKRIPRVVFTGVLYQPQIYKPRRILVTKKSIDRAHKGLCEMAKGPAMDAFAAFLSEVIVYENAPALGDIFATANYDVESAPSIPLVMTSYSRSRPTAPPAILSPR